MTLIKIEQIDTESGRFICPKCSGEAIYDFPRAIGGCPTCDATFLYTVESCGVCLGEHLGQHQYLLELHTVVERGDKNQILAALATSFACGDRTLWWDCQNLSTVAVSHTNKSEVLQ